MNILDEFLQIQKIIPVSKLDIENKKTIILGSNSVIDSVDLVNFILELEMYINQKLHAEIDIYSMVENENFDEFKIIDLEELIFKKIKKL